MNRRAIFLFCTMLLSLWGLVAWAQGQCAKARQDATTAQRDLSSVRDAAASIRRLRVSPLRASDHERLASEMASMIETAARKVGIDQSIAQITHESPRPVADTAYKEKSTLIMLRPVSTAQAVAFMHEMLSSDQALSAKGLRLSASRDSQASEAWSAELTLSYLIFEPSKGR